jgi:hypothetical protein
VRHHHIDLSSVLRGTVCALYSNLVTRPTGAAVRTEIERAIAEIGGRTVTVIDFSEVTLLDFSCADEIVAKLMLRYAPADAEPPMAVPVAPPAADGEGYFLFRGLGDRHLDAVEAVLERHRLAIVAVFDGLPCLIGDVSQTERETWELLRDRGPGDAGMVAEARGESLDAAARRLEALACRGLAVRVEGGYAAVGTLGPTEAAA